MKKPFKTKPTLIIFTSLSVLCYVSFLIFLFSNCNDAAHGSPRNITVLQLFENSILISKNSGKTFENFSEGLPDEFLPLRVTADRENTLYLSTYSNGLYKRGKGEKKWHNITPAAAFTRTIHQNSPHRFRKISAFTAHPQNSLCLAVATKHALYFSSDGGLNWKEFTIPPLLRKHYFTSLAFTGTGDSILAGTSYGGVFVIRGNKLTSFSSGLPFAKYSATLEFYNEISAITASAENRAIMGMSFSGDIFSIEALSNQWKKKAEFTSPIAIHDIADHAGTLLASAGGSIYEISGQGEIRPHQELNEIIQKSLRENTIGIFLFTQTDNYPPLFVQIRHPFEVRPISQNKKKASNKKALYANTRVARKNIDGIINTAVCTNMNALVIDMKDDFGAIFFPTRNSVAMQIGACQNPIDVKLILSKLHSKNMYAIARMVVFKDKYLYRAFEGRYAVADSATGGSWMGNPEEWWLDPHSEFVHTYVISLALELEQLGFDEIQFDYIRFPSDGPIERCRFRHRKDETMFKSEAIIDFLRLAKKTLSIPISIDVYGITGWYHFGNRIGQDFEAIAEYVDVLCPMVYPSHFGTIFYRNRASRENLPGVLVGESIARARMIAGRNAIIRPYLQAFNMLSPTWGPEYILTQILAAEKAGARGYSFWNAKGDYEMVVRAMKK